MEYAEFYQLISHIVYFFFGLGVGRQISLSLICCVYENNLGPLYLTRCSFIYIEFPIKYVHRTKFY